ncbi:MAG: ATP-binding protein [Lachnospiraceae bacterium]
MDRTEPFKEDIYKLLQNPTRENFIKLIFKGSGELDNLDYKENWVKEQKIAEIVIGMANIGGGAIIFGVKENSNHTFESIGLEELEDQEKIHSKIYNFLPNEVKFNVYNYDFTDESYDKITGKLFQILIVDSYDKDIPYVWKKNTDVAEEGCIFYRRGTKTVKANMQEIREMIDRRIEATYSEQSSLELEDHLKQLHVLYNHIHFRDNSSIFNAFFKNIPLMGNSVLVGEKNPLYPNESYEEFVANMISKKKKKIEKILDLS